MVDIKLLYWVGVLVDIKLLYWVGVLVYCRHRKSRNVLNSQCPTI